MTADQAVAMITALRTQVEELAESLDRSRQETADLGNQTDRSIAYLQDQCDLAKAAAKVDALEHDYMRLIDENVDRPLDLRHPGPGQPLLRLRASGQCNQLGHG